MISHRTAHYITLGAYLTIVGARLGNFLIGAADATIDDFCNIGITAEGIGGTDLSGLELHGYATPADGAPDFIDRVVPTEIQAGPDSVCVNVAPNYSIEHDGLARYELKTPKISGLHLNNMSDQDLLDGVKATLHKHERPQTSAGGWELCAAGLAAAFVVGAIYVARMRPRLATKKERGK